MSRDKQNRQTWRDGNDRPQSLPQESAPDANDREKNDESFTIVLLIIGAGVILLILIIILVFVKKLCIQRKTTRRITPSGGMSAFKQNNSLNRFQEERMNFEIKDDPDTLSRYSNTSEIERWSNSPWRTLEDMAVPEPAYYVPPDERILESVPRPSSSIRVKLKEKYEIDLNNFITYIRG